MWDYFNNFSNSEGTSSQSEGKLFSEGSEFLVDESNTVRNDLSVSISRKIIKMILIPSRSGLLVVISSLFTFSPSVLSLDGEVLDSLVGVLKGSFSSGDVIVNTGEFSLEVGKVSLVLSKSNN